MRRALPLLATLALLGCGTAQSGAPAPSLPAARAQLAGAPAALAGLHRQASQVLPGGESAVTARLRALRGHAVVVNKWASWCAPCREEFPVFQRVSVKVGKEVAFLGIDFRDDDASARRYLAMRPLSYPSYSDPRGDASRALKTGELTPVTNFYAPSGKLVFQHAGPYRSDEQLERDIRRYAVGT